MKQTMVLRSGAVISRVTKEEANAKNYLSRETMNLMHLWPSGDPVAYDVNRDGSIQYYFDPNKVTEAPPEAWYEEKNKNAETMTLENGDVIERMSIKKAQVFGYYTKERLSQMHYDVVEEPVAFMRRFNRDIVFFYDKKTAVKQPQMCVKCGKNVRYKHKLCESCFAENLAIRRAEGDAYRSGYFHESRATTLFFDLELTGVYDHDEIISISIVDGLGKVIMDTLVKPIHNKRWKRTEKIHGITPEMVQDAPTLESLIPQIKEIFENADHIIAYGVSTDFSHIKYIYATERERNALHNKVCCCANEYVRFMHEHYPDMTHASLSDAMACFSIDWEGGVAHTSIADTIGCAKVWEKLFPHYYDD